MVLISDEIFLFIDLYSWNKYNHKKHFVDYSSCKG